MIDHMSVGASDMAKARRFYDAIMTPLEYERLLDEGDEASAWGPVKGAYVCWVGIPNDTTKPAAGGNGFHICFLAPSRRAVHEFHAEGLKAGGSDAGPPGLRPQYGERYYAAYVRDPDGNKIEAVCYAVD